MADHDSPKKPGTDIGNRYEVVELLGRGGYSTVYRVWDRKRKRQCALKMMHVPDSLDRSVLRRFQREAEVQAQFDHPLICRLLEYADLEGAPALTMEIVEGWTLSLLIAWLSPLPVNAALALCYQSAQAVAVLHQRSILHRDVKPQNLMLERTGQVKLMDLGLSWSVELTALTTPGTIVGTPTHMAPERIREGRSLPQSDVYALGVMAFQLLTGQLPFDSSSAVTLLLNQIEKPAPALRNHRREIPLAVEALVLRCLEKDPARRPADAGELARHWKTLLKGVDPGQAVEPLLVYLAANPPALKSRSTAEQTTTVLDSDDLDEMADEDDFSDNWTL